MGEDNKDFRISIIRKAMMNPTVVDEFQAMSFPLKEQAFPKFPKTGGVAASSSSSNIPVTISKYRIKDPAAKILILIFAALILGVGFMQKSFEPIILSSAWGRILFITFQAVLIIFFLTLIWRVALLMKYRPAPLFSDEKLPTCGVIVPAYNEGCQVLETLRSIAHSDYPMEKLGIVVIDDGSKDDTWRWIQQAVREMPSRIMPIRLPRNQGKRSALHAGFRQCKSDIFVTIDSDSIVEPRTIRCMVAPFIQNPNVGAVAGNVRILNRNEGLIPKMLDVSFAFSFDFLRASQSMVNTVMCTPGALSAYRSDLVRAVLPQWVNQQFLGRPANIGEDRAMTNMILKLGYYVHFQSTAMVYTNAPTGYQTLCKMFLRWARSNIRETLVMTRFVFTRFREGPMLGARINLLLSLMTLTLGQFMKLVLLGLLVYLPEMFGMRMLVAAVLAGILPAAFFIYRYRNSDALWAFAYSILSVAGLSWIALYAAITPQKTGWLTRDFSPGRTHPLSFAPRVLENRP